jgi:hypothetical protein
MQISTNLCGNELRKAALLITEASRLNMNVSGFGELSVNQSSGNVYLWLEDYLFTLYIGPSDDDLMACWYNSNNGEEEFTETQGLTLDLLNTWAYDLEEEAQYETN